MVSHSSTCVVWFLDSTQALCNILMFQRCCVGETGTFKTDASNIESDQLVVAGGELGQMFPNLPQAVTHRWPPVLCAAAQGTTSSPCWVLHHGEVRAQIYELLARYSADGETFNLSFCEGIRSTFRNCHCCNLLESFTLTPFSWVAPLLCWLCPLLPLHDLWLHLWPRPILLTLFALDICWKLLLSTRWDGSEIPHGHPSLLAEFRIWDCMTQRACRGSCFSLLSLRGLGHGLVPSELPFLGVLFHANKSALVVNHVSCYAFLYLWSRKKREREREGEK